MMDDESVKMVDHGPCVWCGTVGHLDRELHGCCSMECYWHHTGDHGH